MVILQDLDLSFIEYFFTSIYLLFWIALVIILIVYVYNDSKKRRMDPLPYIILIFFTGFIGVLIYVLVRNDIVDRYEVNENTKRKVK